MSHILVSYCCLGKVGGKFGWDEQARGSFEYSSARVRLMFSQRVPVGFVQKLRCVMDGCSCNKDAINDG